ncbi:MAG: hypothetical protein HZB56_11000 [Deltaproteobacteria bacterium]|nr:hypothetical protein [Deltaproteobacteria bacterium]
MASIIDHAGSGQDGPRLDFSAKLGRRVAAFVRALRQERVEVVPSAGVAFVVVGEPERGLELYWLATTGRYHLRDIVRVQGLPGGVARALEERVRACHEAHAAEPRHLLTLARQQVTVVPSEEYGRELRKLVSEVLV